LTQESKDILQGGTIPIFNKIDSKSESNNGQRVSLM